LYELLTNVIAIQRRYNYTIAEIEIFTFWHMMKRVLYCIVGYLAVFLAVYIAGWTTGNLYTFSMVGAYQGGTSVIYHKQALFLFIPALILFGFGIFFVDKAIAWDIPQKGSTLP